MKTIRIYLPYYNTKTMLKRNRIILLINNILNANKAYTKCQETHHDSPAGEMSYFLDKM